MVNHEFDNALKTMKSLGAKIIDNVNFTEFNSSFTYSKSEDWVLGLQVDISNSEVIAIPFKLSPG